MNDFIQDKEKTPLTILIPAFDQPTLLLRALESIVEQTHRPLKIIISFDYTDIDIDMSSVERFCDLKNSPSVTFERYYQKNNLGAYQNLNFLWSKFEGRYLMFMPHDDYLIKPEFLSDSLDILSKDEGCTLIIANTANIVESGFGSLMMNVFSPTPKWEILDGDEFLEKRLFSDLHPAYSAVVLDSVPLRQRGYSKSWISPEKYNSLKLEPDEGFVSLIMASSGHRVAVTSEIVSFRGNPVTSWSKSHFWQAYGFHGLLIQYANFFRIAIELRQKKMASASLLRCKSAITNLPPPLRVLQLASNLGVPYRFLLSTWAYSVIRLRLRLALYWLARIKGTLF